MMVKEYVCDSNYKPDRNKFVPDVGVRILDFYGETAGSIQELCGLSHKTYCGFQGPAFWYTCIVYNPVEFLAPTVSGRHTITQSMLGIFKVRMKEGR